MARIVNNAIIDTAAIGILKVINMVPKAAQINPSLDANIFGALSIILTFKPNVLLIKDEMKQIGL